MFTNTIKKSYVLIDTPERCVDCRLVGCSAYDDSLRCPLLDITIRPDFDGDKPEDCPLKTVELTVSVDM